MIRHLTLIRPPVVKIKRGVFPEFVADFWF
jgi:hypothetical protein